MIEFSCQHCKNLIQCEDQFAGRDAWCRVCKGLILIPGNGGPTLLEDLPPKELIERLFNMQKFAATRADEFKARCFQQQESAAANRPDFPVVNTAEVGNLQNEFKQVESQLEEEQTKAAQLQIEIEEFQSKLDERNAAIESLQQDIPSEEQAEDAQSRIADLERKLDAAETSLASVESDATDLDAATLANARIEELESALAQRDTVAKEDAARIATLEQSLTDNDVQREALGDSAAQSAATIAGIESKLQAAEDALAQSENARTGLEEEAAAKCDELMSRIQSLQSDLERHSHAEQSLAGEKDDAESVRDALRESLDAARQDTLEAEEVVASQSTQLAALQQQIADQNTNQEQLATKAASASDNAAHLERDLRALEAEKTNLQSKLDDAMKSIDIAEKQRADEMGTRSTEHSALEEALTIAQKKVEQLSLEQATHLETIDHIQSELEKMKRATEDQNHEVNEARNQAEKALADASAERDALHAELEALRSEQKSEEADASVALAALREEIQTLSARNQSLLADHAAQEANIAAREAGRSDDIVQISEARFSEMEREIEDARQRIIGLERENESLKQGGSRYSAAAERLTESLNVIKKELKSQGT